MVWGAWDGVEDRQAVLAEGESRAPVCAPWQMLHAPLTHTHTTTSTTTRSQTGPIGPSPPPPPSRLPSPPLTWRGLSQKGHLPA